MAQPLTDQELKRLKDTKNLSEWTDACNAITAVRGGAYPSDWFMVVLASGLMDQIQMSWFRK